MTSANTSRSRAKTEPINKGALHHESSMQYFQSDFAVRPGRLGLLRGEVVASVHGRRPSCQNIIAPNWSQLANPREWVPAKLGRFSRQDESVAGTRISLDSAY